MAKLKFCKKEITKTKVWIQVMQMVELLLYQGLVAGARLLQQLSFLQLSRRAPFLCVTRCDTKYFERARCAQYLVLSTVLRYQNTLYARPRDNTKLFGLRVSVQRFRRSQVLNPTTRRLYTPSLDVTRYQ